MNRADKIQLDGFYPESLKITKVTDNKNHIIIELKSQKHSHKCWKCGEEMGTYHGTKVRTVQDLPILGKKVTLKIVAYEYYCKNEACGVKSFREDYGEFIGRNKRMTNRCEELIKTLAVETSCAGASRICEKIGITLNMPKIRQTQRVWEFSSMFSMSRDTIIGMLKKEAEKIEIFDGDSAKINSLGIDDFAYKKGQTYCTIVCDGENHRPIEVLNGRDGESLKEWLSSNKSHMNITKVTRDRASAYAKVISDIIPEAMQVADRFHLHQNLLDAVKEALKNAVANEIEIPNDYSLSNSSAESDEEQTQENDDVKDEELPFYLGESENTEIDTINKLEVAENNQDKKK